MKITDDIDKRIRSSLKSGYYNQLVNLIYQYSLPTIFVANASAEAYGNWLLVMSFYGFATFLEAGFKTYYANEVTIRYANSHKYAGEIQRNSWEYVQLLFIAISIAAVVIVATGTILEIKFFLDNGIAVIVVFFSMACDIAIGVIMVTYRAVGKQHYGVNFSSVKKLIELITLIVLILLSADLNLLIISLLLINVVALRVAILHVKKNLSWTHWGLGVNHFMDVRDLLIRSKEYTLFPLGLTLREQGVLWVVGLFLGPISVAIYSVTRTFVSVPIQIINIYNRSISPELSLAYLSRKSKLINKLVSRGLINCAIVLFFFNFLYIIFGEMLFDLWLKGNMKLDLEVLVPMLFIVFLKCFWSIVSLLATSANLHKKSSVNYFLSSLSIFVLSYALLSLSFSLIAVLYCIVFVEVVQLTFEGLFYRRIIRSA